MLICPIDAVTISGADQGTVFVEVVNEVLRAEFGKIGGGGSAARVGICEQLLALVQSGILQICCDIQDIKMNQGVDRSMFMKQVGILNDNHLAQVLVVGAL
jgi:hypothetical protein